MEQTFGYFCQNLLEVQSLWWNIWVDTPTKLPLAIIESGVLTFKNVVRLKDCGSQANDTHASEFIRRFRCIFAQTFCENSSLWLLSSRNGKTEDFVGETLSEGMEEVEKNLLPKCPCCKTRNLQIAVLISVVRLL
jgi:hypothetical protein